jgi:hypothetical protein
MATPLPRIYAFDWLRGVAVLVMIQTHALVLLLPAIHQQALFKNIVRIDGLVAPSFIFSAGFSLGLVQVRARSISPRMPSGPTGSRAGCKLAGRMNSGYASASVTVVDKVAKAVQARASGQGQASRSRTGVLVTVKIPGWHDTAARSALLESSQRVDSGVQPRRSSVTQFRRGVQELFAQ